MIVEIDGHCFNGRHFGSARIVWTQAVHPNTPGTDARNRENFRVRVTLIGGSSMDIPCANELIAEETYRFILQKMKKDHG